MRSLPFPFSEDRLAGIDLISPPAPIDTTMTSNSFGGSYINYHFPKGDDSIRRHYKTGQTIEDYNADTEARVEEFIDWTDDLIDGGRSARRVNNQPNNILNNIAMVLQQLNVEGWTEEEIAEFQRAFADQPKYPVNLKRLSEDAIIPTYGTEQAACFDIYATEDKEILPGQTAIIGTGWAMEIPVGTKLHLTTRSGMSTKGVSVLNAPGTVDADYRGEVKIVLHNHNLHQNDLPPYYGAPYTVKKGDRIAQGEVKAYTASTFKEVAELSDTLRGAGGLGSTGK
jgi:dUTP pyrophosphatase